MTSPLPLSDHGEKLRRDHEARRPPDRLDVLGVDVAVLGIAAVGPIKLMSRGDKDIGTFGIIYQAGKEIEIFYACPASVIGGSSQRIVADTMDHHRRRVLDAWDRERRRHNDA